MKTAIPRIVFPELMFGFVAPIGSDISDSLQEFEKILQGMKYNVIRIKVTSVFRVLEKYIKPKVPLNESPSFKRYESYIAYGDQLREEFENDAVLAVTAISQIYRKRLKLQEDKKAFSKTAFLLHQFKRKEEIDLLRSIYGRLFFQVSVYSRRGARVDYLSRDFAKTNNTGGPQKFRHLAEKIIQDDEDEVEKDHGQRVAKIFHDADFIINKDISVSAYDQVKRFIDLIFGSNFISPTKLEYGMFMAKAAALRTLDLSRQVGAAIFTCESEIISLGSNEVPKAGGGTYWASEPYDDREYVRGRDSNFERKREILAEIVNIINPTIDVDSIFSKKEIKDSQFMDALEYGRIVHAEMSAIADAARLGRSVKDATLFCTTFPCHMCAKHIVAAGIKSVVFLEPYPKSLAFDLHADSLEIEGGDRGHFNDYPSVSFEHFYGITPRRYCELFERSEKRIRDGVFRRYLSVPAQPIIDIKFPFYSELEFDVLARAGPMLGDLAADD